MSFISFLKKAGTILADIAETYVGLEPELKAAVPAAGPVLDKLDTVFNQVIAVEGAFAAAFPTGTVAVTSQQKLLAAASLVGPILSSVEAISGKQIADEAAYVAAVQVITGGIADLMNSLKATSNTTTVAAAITAPAASVVASGVAAKA